MKKLALVALLSAVGLANAGGNYGSLTYDVKDKQKMAQILNQYYNKKTPEIQKEIDKYLHAV